MDKQRIADLASYWRQAPMHLKTFVMLQIKDNGYYQDPTGEHLYAHIWECKKWVVTPECCAELIAHYAEVKRVNKEREERSSLVDVATAKLFTQIHDQCVVAWNELEKE